MSIPLQINAIELLANLTQSELEHINSYTTWTTFIAGQEIIAHGDTSTSIFLIAEGSVRATTFSVSGKEICFQHLAAGNMFGELSAIDSLPRTTSIIAEKDCVLGIISADQFWQLMEQYPAIMAGVLKRLTSLVRFLCSRVYEYGALGTRERTRAEILRLAKKYMTNDKKAIITAMPTHEDIANRIASHREAVTKEFSYLTKSGLIKKTDNTLIVPDVQALSATILENII